MWFLLWNGCYYRRNSILGVENVFKRLNFGLYGGNIVSGIVFLNEIDVNLIGKVSIHYVNFFWLFFEKSKILLFGCDN